ncbi:MAG: cellulose biosynthesis cyclic di-GMP-binding regulatory protein BcsB [Bauldia sp.]|nr:cellulose biosynthesis cyclic di-GMP-binding regulatory protein BcsB [Bauldia sp.]
MTGCARGVATAAALLLAALPGQAQEEPAPFDMGVEAPPRPVEAAPPAAPVIDAGELRLVPLSGIPPDEPATASPDGALAVATPSTLAFQRPIIPFDRLTLAGEWDFRAWSVYLTNDQAAAPAVLHLGYVNALLVAPEASALRVLINDRPVLVTQLTAAERPSTLSVQLPEGLLRAGANRIRIEASQRHRTDCTIESTYDLWTEIDPAGTYISFGDPTAGMIDRVGDLAAIGVDAAGVTTVNIVMPSLAQPAAAAALFRLAQGLALRIGAPTQLFRVSMSDAGEAGPGILTVVLGTRDEIAAITGRPADGTAISFLADTAGPTMVVTGSSWSEIEAAVESILAPLEPGPNQERRFYATAAWQVPEVPVVHGGEAFTLAELGITTVEFSGRRYTTSFAVAMPADLYAQAYGYATIYLDAAYAPGVLPGSHVDVYVNGEIAATTPIVDGGGGIFRRLAIEVPLRHFTPGVNRLTIEAIVPTHSDSVCAPGATAAGGNRFVLFDTTEFSMPSFGRALQYPDLAVLAGTGYPLVGDAPVSLVLGRAGGFTFSAAATLLAKLAMQAGRPFEFVLAASNAAVSAPFGVFVGDITQLPPRIADQAGIDPVAIEAWQDPLGMTPGGSAPAAAPDTEATFERWRDALSGGGGWRGQVSSLEEWLRRTFDFSFASLRFGAASPVNTNPPASAGLMLAQGGLGSGTSWTVLTAPSRQSLQSYTELFVRAETWDRIAGRAALYRPATGAVEIVPLEGADLAIVDASSPRNLRLVATNWLSKNLIIYGSLLLGLCVILAFSTTWLLKSLGRHE